jgi:hypothetical protein
MASLFVQPSRLLLVEKSLEDFGPEEVLVVNLAMKGRCDLDFIS